MNLKTSAAVRGLFALLAVAFAVSTASAEPSAGKEKKIPQAVLKKYDKNNDGVLDDQEKAAWEADKAAAKKKKDKKGESSESSSGDTGGAAQ